MNTIEKAGVDKKPGQTPKVPQAPARSSRVLSVVRGNDERSLHLSPILQKIKDDGPALIDGEVLKEAAAMLKLTKPASVAIDAKAAVAAPGAVPQPLLADKYVKVLLGFCAALTLGLCCSLYVAWQQQQRLANVEYLLETLVITTTR